MLIDFTVENFRSYRDKKRLSLVASVDPACPENCIKCPDIELSLLRTAAIYGSNASGKSNLLAAMNFLADLLASPLERPDWEDIYENVPGFALDPAAFNKSSTFAVRFLTNDVIHEYALSIKKNVVEEEKLVAYPMGRPQTWYHRKLRKFIFNKTYLRGPKLRLQELTSPRKPFLAVAAAFEHPQLSAAAQWIVTNLRRRIDFQDILPRFGRSEDITARRMYEDQTFRSWAISFLRFADLGIASVDVQVENRTRRVRRVDRSTDGTMHTEVEDKPERVFHPSFHHPNSDGEFVAFVMSDESLGTRRLFRMMAPIYDVLSKGQVAVVDEFSASMHPTMVRELVKLFHEPKLNTKGAQLVFATHDATLLSGQLFRRDQVWFTEKDPRGATDIYSLQDIKGVRSDDAWEKGYLRGRYGAIPFFTQFDFPEPAHDQVAKNEIETT